MGMGNTWVELRKKKKTFALKITQLRDELPGRSSEEGSQTWHTVLHAKITNILDNVNKNPCMHLHPGLPFPL